MFCRDCKLHVILIAFVVCLAAFLGGQRLAYSQRVAAPLERTLAALPGVVAVELESHGQGTDVVLHVEPGADLPRLYREAEAAAREQLGAGLSRVRLADRRTPALVEAFYRIHLPLQEGAATGRFTAMAEQLADLATNLSLDDYRVYVDERYVYVMMAAGDAYLYEIIARPHRVDPVGGAAG